MKELRSLEEKEQVAGKLKQGVSANWRPSKWSHMEPTEHQRPLQVFAVSGGAQQTVCGILMEMERFK